MTTADSGQSGVCCFAAQMVEMKTVARALLSPKNIVEYMFNLEITLTASEIFMKSLDPQCAGEG